MLTEAQIVELTKLLAEVTEGPWAWDSSGDKDNGFAVGLACTEDGTMLSGKIPDDEWIEDHIIYKTLVGEIDGATVNYADAALICAMRNYLPELLAELARLRPLAEIGELAVGEREAVNAWLGWADSDSQKVADAQRALREAIAAYRETQACEAGPPASLLLEIGKLAVAHQRLCNRYHDEGEGTEHDIESAEGKLVSATMDYINWGQGDASSE